MEEWKEYKLGDICEFQNGYAFKSSDFSTDGKYRVVKIKELKDGLVKFFEDSSFVECDDNTILEKYSIKKGDVLFALTGDPVSKPNPNSWVGRVALYNNLEKSLLNQRVCKVQPKELINPFFLYYYFRQRDVFYSLASKATGSASQANISTKTIGDLIVNIPSLEIQNKIASILSSLDDKIEVNRRINENLEQQAQALFKSWFVDFEPFKNGEFVESELGMIPKGWRVGTLSDICVTNKRVHKGEFKNSIEYIDTGSVTRNVVESVQLLNPVTDKIPSRARRGVTEGDIIYSSVRPNQCHYAFLFNPSSKTVVSTGFIVITANWSGYRYYIYQYLIQDEIIKKLQAIAEQSVSTFPSINASDITQQKLVIPPDEIVGRYAEIVLSFFLQINNNHDESRRLAQLRDTLLPRLMSGKIKVNGI